MNNKTNLQIISESEHNRYKNSLNSFSRSNNYMVGNELVEDRIQNKLNKKRLSVSLDMNDFREQVMLNEPVVILRDDFKYHNGINLNLLLRVNDEMLFVPGEDDHQPIDLRGYGAYNANLAAEVIDNLNNRLRNFIDNSHGEITLDGLKELAGIQVDFIRSFSKPNNPNEQTENPFTKGGASTTLLIASDFARRAFNEIWPPEVEGRNRFYLNADDIDLNLLHGPIRGIVNSPDGSEELEKYKEDLVDLIILHNIGTIPEPEFVLNIPKKDLDKMREEYEKLKREYNIPIEPDVKKEDFNDSKISDNTNIPDEIIKDIAEETHEAIREMKKGLKMKNEAWDELSQRAQTVIINSVNKVNRDNLKTGKEFHEKLVIEKEKAGWKYGPEKNAKFKTNNSILPFDDLEPEKKLRKNLIANSMNKGLEMARAGNFDKKELMNENRWFLQEEAYRLNIKLDGIKGPGE